MSSITTCRYCHLREHCDSKGFMWMSHSQGTALYWSHARAHFNFAEEGD